MTPSWTAVVAGSRWLQRVLVVLCAIVPLLVVTLACTPALVVLPFLPAHSARATAIVRQLIAWTRTALIASRSR
ncbi:MULTISPECIES: hypothetical protein [Streptomyces]|uniref:dTMP kinase n=1 Tax=Streptomyces canarius TaxID=285453 RepID=A0ABQ3CYA4_9ACTN|nr:hypothetical protein [Streptomyces canarius]GHA49837.1 hypothetical protein GCM10010345_62940 [Streptomyces canarius]